MAIRPQDALNENLAPKIKTYGLKLISRLLVFVGRPTYLILKAFVLVIYFFFRITGQFLQLILITLKHRPADKYSVKSNLISKFFEFLKRLIKQPLPKFMLKFPTKRFAKKGVVFSSRRYKRKIFFLKLKKGTTSLWPSLIKSLKKNSKKFKDISWKIQVFFLALPKFWQKLKLLLPRLILPKITLLKLLTFFFLATFTLSFLAGIAFWWYILKDLPKPGALKQRKQSVSTKIYDRNGVLLYTIFKDQNRTPVVLDNIPKQARLATIAIEDAEFYSHPGFSIKGITRAFIKNLRERKLSGGSTITQQLVKNTLLSPEKTYVRKLKETVLAIQVELTFSKDNILEMYLNEVSYGGTAYGIQEAARMYFNKDVDGLTLAEAALLAGLPKSPTAYSPFGSNPEKALERQKEVLRLMQENGFITAEQKSIAEKEEISFSQYKIPIKAPHFVFYVREILEEKYGKELVEAGGLEVTTTLDYQMQKFAEEVVKTEVEKLKNLNVTNGAVVILSPQTGEILAMVGSRDYFDSTIDGNVNIALRPRQPGSSIKVVNYAFALSNGYTAATIIPDTPVTFLVENQPPYSPNNYEGGFRGNLSLRNALAESRNIPAVRVLHSYGVKSMLEMGSKLGITTWDNPDNYGLSLTLGGGEVKLLDLTRVYATIANYGNRPEIVSLLKVTNYQGKVLEEFECSGKVDLVEKVVQVDQEKDKPFNQLASQQFKVVSASSQSALFNPAVTPSGCNGEQVLNPGVAFLITDILKDNIARAPAFGTNSLLLIPNHKEVAVKTGTSNNLRDNLAIGFTQNYVVAAWVGNNDNSQMSRIASGVTGATPIFHNIMSALLANEPNDDWQVPSGLVKLPICPFTATLACNGCPNKMEWFLEENKPEIACNPEWFKKDVPSDLAEDKREEVKFEAENQVDINNLFFRQLLEEQNKLQKKKQRRGRD